MRIITFSLSSLLFVLFAFTVFRIFVRNDYRKRGKLSVFSILLETIVFAVHANLFYLVEAAKWASFPKLPENALHRTIGLSMMVFGAFFTIWAMIGLGFKAVFGQKSDDLRTNKFYSLSRNPQILAYTLVVLGCAFLWPSVLSLIWVLIYLVIAHTMVLTEEEHLSRLHKEQYEKYVRRVPRYLPLPLLR